MIAACRPFSVCDLHVGTEKTGTTSLQRFLGLNRTALLNAGVFVPQCLAPAASSGNINHIFLTTLAFEDARKPIDLQLNYGIQSIADVPAHRKAMAQSLVSEIAGLDDCPRRMLLSNEHIHSRLRSDADLIRLKTYLNQFCESIRVIAYLRPQHELAQSVSATSLRRGARELHQIPDFDTSNGFDPVLGVDFKYFDYSFLLDRLARVFGEELMSIRIYDADELIGSDILDDFFGRAGINISEMIRPRRENTNFDAVGVGFMVAFNRFVEKNPSYAKLRGVVNAHLTASYQGKGLRVSREAARSFQSLFDESNEQVRIRWFPQRASLFQTNFDAYSEMSEIIQLKEDDIFKVFSGILDNAL